ncbi:cytochrome c and c1 heme-lyase [Testicularia cyperi]|uniref:Holocytochrome c-type synthase n=1 Tax=Testicularia cyperi TaxID=1882483 RepID=A0A317XVZ0_9BASI|nr:cytochrome c and c1 heme-lyase [Testicularia cyperi]
MWPFSLSPSSAAGSSSVSADKCPVDEETRQAWLKANPGRSSPFQPAPDSAADPSASSLTTSAAATPSSSSSKYDQSADEARLSKEREISSIPRSFAQLASNTSTPAQAAQPSAALDATASAPVNATEDQDGKWVYPSPLQFYNAMKRKNQNPNVADMDIVVPIHNAVNEQAWRQILQWERMWTNQTPGSESTKLISFKGRPKDLTWHAWFRGLAGYQHPFDRHDWTVDRDGKQVRYIIDFYSGRSAPPPNTDLANTDDTIAKNFGASQSQSQQQPQPLSFYLDVRPAPSTPEGIAMRTQRLFYRYFGQPGSAPQ